ncbi:prepilin-type N-terminal cleavage/methylation domain-containing protein [Massilia sp. IC2-278]|uniref:PulJ/GspJ family protein n=1 Tax=Massilia sp. IC2-278 TaxID=2887200 RepID=UPI001E5A2791|nr:prepilin-type N-terminal cleavage/methylation domain-containing protein [Massilia sp. IC2-278]MCC2959877.1 prepilin-type N-terminal cleavage/methylation domain-containing protein [Massilia sp. IC2-278]
MHKTRGFTLIELLVAIGILAMVAVLGWRGLDGIVRARSSLTEQMESTRGMQLAFAQLQSDCEHAADASILGRRPFLLQNEGRITLVRTVFNENEPARLQVIAYRLVNGQLLRRESIATRDLVQLDGLWQAAITDADTTPPVLLQGGIEAMGVLVWQNGAWRAQVETNPPAPVTSASALAVTGLQVVLRTRGYPQPLTKSFLLGSL